jgi:phosphatidylglycerophosphatase A
VSQLEASLSRYRGHDTGIVLDDIMAGIYTLAVMRLLLTWGIL